MTHIFHSPQTPTFAAQIPAQISSPAEMQRVVLEHKRAGKRVGVVPTMGYLHDGHASLIRAARAETDVVITTIFVNPLQFAPTEDLSRYPRDLERDKTLAYGAGTDILFTPTPEMMYPHNFGATVSITGVSMPFEGAFRPTHFDGVATVVLKLFNIVQPDKAFFGQKDYQQCMVIAKMVHDLNLPIEVVICPTRRETDGLAMSSRNVYLSPEDRIKATTLHKALQAASVLHSSGELRRTPLESIMQRTLHEAGGFTVDYAAAADALTLHQPEHFEATQHVVLLIAARLGSTRLIDNMLLANEI